MPLKIWRFSFCSVARKESSGLPEDKLGLAETPIFESSNESVI
jgi:hypothetical protein